MSTDQGLWNDSGDEVLLQACEEIEKNKENQFDDAEDDLFLMIIDQDKKSDDEQKKVVPKTSSESRFTTASGKQLDVRESSKAKALKMFREAEKEADSGMDQK